MLWLCCLPPPVCSVSVRPPGLSLSFSLSSSPSVSVFVPHSCPCARRCYESCRASCCVRTACRYGAGAEPVFCDRSLCPWTTGGRGPRQRASATASCAQAPACPNPSPTDWRRRPPWWREGAVTFASARSAGVSRALECAPLAHLELHPPTARRV